MKYVSIDIETTGLDPNVNDIVELGAVIDDLSKHEPLESLPTFHCYVVKDTYATDAYCAFLHQAIFDRIARRWEPNVMERYQFLEEQVARRHVEHPRDDVERIPGVVELAQYHGPDAGIPRQCQGWSPIA